MNEQEIIDCGSRRIIDELEDILPDNAEVCQSDEPARMGYYKDSTGEWKENGIGMGWCRQCGAKIRFCKCSENAKADKSK